LVRNDFHARLVETPQCRQIFSKLDNGAVKFEQNSVLIFRPELRAKFGTKKSRFRLRIGNFALPGEGAELLAAAAPDRFDQLGIGMIDEVEKRSIFGVFFTHKEQRNKGLE